MAGKFVEDAGSSLKKKTINCDSVLIFLCVERLVVSPSKDAKNVRDFVSFCTQTYFVSNLVEGTELGRFLKQYESKLRSDPKYPEVLRAFKRHIDFKVPINQLRSTVISLLMQFFTPVAVLTPHDDWIMMIFLITTDIIETVLLSSNSILTRNIVNWTLNALELLQPSKISFGNWLFAGWLKNKAGILSAARRPNLLSDPAILKREVMNIINFRDQKGYQNPEELVKKPWKTVFVRSSFATGDEAFMHLQREIVKPPLQDYSTNHITYSFIVARLSPDVDIRTRNEFFEIGRSKRSYCGRLVHLIIQALADKIEATELYKRIEERVVDMGINNLPPQRTPQSMLTHIFETYFMRLHDIVTYDQIVMVLLLMTKCINICLVKKKVNHAAAIYRDTVGNKIFHSNWYKECIINGWAEVGEHIRPLLHRSNFFILVDYRLLGETRVIPKEMKRQTSPLIERALTFPDLLTAVEQSSKKKVEILVKTENPNILRSVDLVPVKIVKRKPESPNVPNVVSPADLDAPAPKKRFSLIKEPQIANTAPATATRPESPEKKAPESQEKKPPKSPEKKAPESPEQKAPNSPEKRNPVVDETFAPLVPAEGMDFFDYVPPPSGYEREFYEDILQTRTIDHRDDDLLYEESEVGENPFLLTALPESMQCSQMDEVGYESDASTGDRTETVLEVVNEFNRSFHLNYSYRGSLPCPGAVLRVQNDQGDNVKVVVVKEIKQPPLT